MQPRSITMFPMLPSGTVFGVLAAIAALSCTLPDVKVRAPSSHRDASIPESTEDASAEGHSERSDSVNAHDAGDASGVGAAGRGGSGVAGAKGAARAEAGAAAERDSGPAGVGGQASNSAGSRTCTRDIDCSAENPRCMRNACVSQVVAEMFLCHQPDAPIDSTPVKYSFRVVEYVVRAPPGNITALACFGNDVRCVNAIQPLRISQDTGVVEFELPRGFLGFFEVHSDAMPALSYLTKPIQVDTVDRDLQLYSQETFMTFAMLTGAKANASKGVALLEAFDCTGTPVGGVHFESRTGGVSPFYIVNQVPSAQASVTSLDAVNRVADGGFLNVEPGFVTFTAHYGVGGPVLGAFNVAVSAGTITFVDMYF